MIFRSNDHLYTLLGVRGSEVIILDPSHDEHLNNSNKNLHRISGSLPVEKKKKKRVNALQNKLTTLTVQKRR